MCYYINWGLCNLPTFKLPVVDRGRTEHCKRAFAYAGPVARNQLPQHILAVLKQLVEQSYSDN